MKKCLWGFIKNALKITVLMLDRKPDSWWCNSYFLLLLSV